VQQVSIFIGPPGSGKDTQAELLHEEYGFVTMPSSQIIRAKFSENPSDPVMIREKENFDTGKLVDPNLVSAWMMEFVALQAGQGKSMVFSGSPRTPHEAHVEAVELPKLFGIHGVVVFHLQLSEQEARARIAKRRFCKAKNHVIPGTPEFAYLTHCPKDQSELFARPLDDASLQDTRFAEYRELTEPCIQILRDAGCSVHTIDASKTIQSIHHDIVSILERSKEPTPTL
jgi:adenylate kinase